MRLVHGLPGRQAGVRVPGGGWTGRGPRGAYRGGPDQRRRAGRCPAGRGKDLFMTLIINGAALATVDDSGTEYASGHIVVDGERITAIGAGPAPDVPGAT